MSTISFEKTNSAFLHDEGALLRRTVESWRCKHEFNLFDNKCIKCDDKMEDVHQRVNSFHMYLDTYVDGVFNDRQRI